MRDEILGPNLDSAEARVANDAKLVFERTRHRDRVDGETRQVHCVRLLRTASLRSPRNRAALRPFVTIFGSSSLDGYSSYSAANEQVSTLAWQRQADYRIIVR